MDTDTLEYLYTLVQTAVQQEHWKTALNSLTTALRKKFVFDNIAIYLQDTKSHITESIYARAIGRGKNAEADAAWGESIADKVLDKEEMVTQGPFDTDEEDNRLAQAYLLGMPLYIDQKLGGALVLIRFGGPAYLPEHIRLASLTALLISHILECRTWKSALSAFETVQRQINMQEEFVATISHELRTPLGFIKGYGTTLLRQDTIWDEATQREFLTIIIEEADCLTELIEKILESVNLQNQTLPLEYQPLRLDALIRDVVTRACSQYKNIDIHLDFKSLPPMQGDSTRLTEVFENLISNAVKYAPGSKIRITGQCVDKQLKVSFTDHGPGIPAEHLPLIFERFYRVPGQAKNIGTGLGLFICKQIIQAHHGKIWADSTPGKGTTFHIELHV